MVYLIHYWKLCREKKWICNSVLPQIVWEFVNKCLDVLKGQSTILRQQLWTEKHIHLCTACNFQAGLTSGHISVSDVTAGFIISVKGEVVLWHHCLGCGYRGNRVAKWEGLFWVPLVLEIKVPFIFPIDNIMLLTVRALLRLWLAWIPHG